MGIILKMLPDSKPEPRIPVSNVNAKHPKTSSKEVESVEIEEDEERKPLV